MNIAERLILNLILETRKLGFKVNTLLQLPLPLTWICCYWKSFYECRCQCKDFILGNSKLFSSGHLGWKGKERLQVLRVTSNMSQAKFKRIVFARKDKCREVFIHLSLGFSTSICSHMGLHGGKDNESLPWFLLSSLWSKYTGMDTPWAWALNGHGHDVGTNKIKQESKEGPYEAEDEHGLSPRSSWLKMTAKTMSQCLPASLRTTGKAGHQGG